MHFHSATVFKITYPKPTSGIIAPFESFTALNQEQNTTDLAKKTHQTRRSGILNPRVWLTTNVSKCGGFFRNLRIPNYGQPVTPLLRFTLICESYVNVKMNVRTRAYEGIDYSNNEDNERYRCELEFYHGPRTRSWVCAGKWMAFFFCVVLRFQNL